VKTLVRSALTIGVVALVAGCGALRQAQDDMQPAIGAPGAMSQNLQLTKSARAPSSSKDTLIYAFENEVGGHGIVLQYPSGKLISDVYTPLEPLSACADDSGDVFAGGTGPSAGVIVEYAFGATTPSARVTLGDGEAVRGCSVDATGDVATIVRYSAGSYFVAVLPEFQGPGQGYNYSAMAIFVSLTYDGSGNLFLLGTSLTGKEFYLAELPHGGSAFEPISFNLGKHVAQVRTLQWDGTSLTVEATYDDGRTKSWRWPERIYRFTVSGSSAKLVDIIRFNGLHNLGTFGTSWIQTSRNLVMFASSSRDYYGIWKYPIGGKRLKRLRSGTRRDDEQFYAAVMVAPASGSRAQR
jgi:hypothetical protein